VNQSLAYEIAAVMPLAVSTGLFSSLASFSAPPANQQGPTGNIVTAYQPVAGLQNIPCMDAPESIGRVSSDESKAIMQLEAGRYRHVLLGGCYQQLRDATGQGWQCSITDPDGITKIYDMTGAEDDSQATQTRVRLQIVTL
jgi:hypothetical protein